ncbi:MAG: nuclear transport factor 2 family protein [bacterium]|nr:nuclear transport factor 2 family protein [bacterium]MCY4194290.1 nuclear transport factor 2 family protein [bacterium]MCY4272473.1 nuclear transport factor 2 family protein [bacterium]
MSDREDLADLAAQYARCVDRGDPEGVAACFTPDGVLRIVNLAEGGKVVAERNGRDEIVRAISRMSYDATFHFVGQQQTDIAGDTATGETYCIAHHLTIPDDGSPATDYIMHIRYQDRFARVDAGWRLAVRELHIDWTETRLTEAG